MYIVEHLNQLYILPCMKWGCLAKQGWSPMLTSEKCQFAMSLTNWYVPNLKLWTSYITCQQRPTYDMYYEIMILNQSFPILNLVFVKGLILYQYSYVTHIWCCEIDLLLSQKYDKLMEKYRLFHFVILDQDVRALLVRNYLSVSTLQHSPHSSISYLLFCRLTSTSLSLTSSRNYASPLVRICVAHNRIVTVLCRNM